MIELLLKITSLLVGILDRYLDEQEEYKEEIENEAYKKALANGDYNYAAYLLNRRLRRLQRNRPK